MANTNITSELLDSLLAGRDPKTVFEQDGLLDELKKALAERILSTELDHHLGQDEEQAVGNHRNGRSQKTVLTESGTAAVWHGDLAGVGLGGDGCGAGGSRRLAEPAAGIGVRHCLFRCLAGG